MQPAVVSRRCDRALDQFPMSVSRGAKASAMIPCVD